MITLAVLATTYLCCIIFIRMRCKDTFPLKRQLSDFSTFMVPFNIPAYVTSKVPLGHYIDPAYFPDTRILQDNWKVIRDEAISLYENGYIAKKEDLPASSFYKDNRWTSFYLKCYDADIPSARELAPKTMALIDQVPSMNLALFACLNPGKTINNHHDPFAFTLRYSLGLSTPNSDKSGIIVNGEDYKWADGESVMFDETYLHRAYNDDEVPRIILMTDVDRPLKIKLLQKFYYQFGRFFNSMFVIDNVDPSKSAIGNKIGRYLNIYKAFMKRFKHWNKPLYVTFKIVVVSLILAAIFFNSK